MESSGTPKPAPSSVLFARGVIAGLAIWATLRIAVQESWGGPNASSKRTWLASEIVESFEEQIPAPDDQYVEEMLLQVMSDEFETVIEDGSAESVAKDIAKLWDDTRIEKQDLVLKFEDLAEKVKGKRPNAQEKVVSDDEDDWDDEEEGEDEEMDEDEAPQLLENSSQQQQQPREPEVDEDGFTMVKGKGRR